MNGHHLVLGELIDIITGETIADTHDERYRQKLGRLLVEQKGYDRSQIRARFPLMCRAGENRAIVPIDFVLSSAQAVGMIVKYGPGSLTTRHRSALAASRLVSGHQVPIVVVTNGEDAEILDGASGEIIGSGLEAIPTGVELAEIISGLRFEEISSLRVEMESRILYCYEVDGSCPCDDTVCRL
ncbi:MAG: hypothetical protein AMJ54_09575 [Deltaproteobacteria bacterium SG8_13]|nr:MAG: hypothetical protein AMJ54_09575 [Deltaproteobacteria bacterium SG8_13]